MAANGRPTQLTPEIIDKVAELLPVAMYMESVAAMIGVAKKTVYDWIRRGAREEKRIANGEKPDPKEAIYASFSHAVKKAMADGEREILEAIRQAVRTQWQAGAWLLERRFPQKWSNFRAELRRLEKEVEELRKNGNRPADPPTPPTP